MSAGSCDDCTKKICPLPRIGSKEWEWEAIWKTLLYGQPEATYASKWTRYTVIQGANYCVVIDPLQQGSERRVGSELSLLDAKTLAESRARRDWRRENRGKK